MFSIYCQTPENMFSTCFQMFSERLKTSLKTYWKHVENTGGTLFHAGGVWGNASSMYTEERGGLTIDLRVATAWFVDSRGDDVIFK